MLFLKVLGDNFQHFSFKRFEKGSARTLVIKIIFNLKSRRQNHTECRMSFPANFFGIKNSSDVVGTCVVGSNVVRRSRRWR